MKVSVSTLRAGDVIRDQFLDLRVGKVDAVVIDVGCHVFRHAFEVTTWAGERQGIRQYLPDAQVDIAPGSTVSPQRRSTRSTAKGNTENVPAALHALADALVALRVSAADAERVCAHLEGFRLARGEAFREEIRAAIRNGEKLGFALNHSNTTQRQGARP